MCAKIAGGITSRPSGRLGNIIFGAARTEQGKVVTAREAVDPSNPNTTAQQTQRTKFSESLSIVQDIGPSVYQEDWNRARGQLPGFQSLMQILLNNIDDSEVLSPPPDIPLGNLHFPDTWTLQAGLSPGDAEFTWDTATPGGASATDTAVMVLIPADAATRGNFAAAYAEVGDDRSAGSDQISTGVGAGVDMIGGLYFRASDPSAPPLSLAKFDVFTTS